MVDGVKLTTYFGERDRVGGRFLADALAELYAAHDVRTSCVLRGVEGFGARHRLQTERLLTLSEDLPLVSVAVDARERIERLADDVAVLQPGGLVTLERARLLDSPLPAAEALPPVARAPAGGPRAGAGDALKLTLWVGRQARAADGRPAHVAVVDALRGAGVDGATVLLGVDGTIRGARERARFFARNGAVPLMIVAIGETERIAAALPRLSALQPQPLATLERVRVCKRDGVRLAPPHSEAEADGMWQKLTVVASERARHDGAPLHAAIVRRLREEGAAGATSLRGTWGYHGDHAPHGDRFFALARRAPVLTVAIDRPLQAERWFSLIDAATARTGLVTSELVPAFVSPAS